MVKHNLAKSFKAFYLNYHNPPNSLSMNFPIPNSLPPNSLRRKLDYLKATRSFR